MLEASFMYILTQYHVMLVDTTLLHVNDQIICSRSTGSEITIPILHFIMVLS